MAGLMKNVDKSNVINKLYLNSLEYISESVFLYNSLKIGWLNYVDNKNGGSKKERSYKKIINSLSKIDRLDSVKKLKLVKENNVNEIKKMYKDSVIDSGFKKNMINYINSCESIREIFLLFLDEYNKINKGNITSEVIELPKKKSVEKKVSEDDNKISYYVDDTNHLYVNVIKKDDIFIIDSNSLIEEKKIYDKCLVSGELKLFLIDGVKLSSFEKKRRIYIQNMFDFEKKLNVLKFKKMDITYPINQHYEYSRFIIDNLFKELVDFSIDNNVYDNLFSLTKKTYGCERFLKLYDDVNKELVSKISKVDKYVWDEIVDSVGVLKKSLEYREFANINGLVPSLEDIYEKVNNKIINSIPLLIEEYFLNMKYAVKKVTKYMKKDDLVKFYYEVKNVLLRSKLNRNKTTQCCIELQKEIGKILSRKLKLNESKVIVDILKDEKLY